MSPHYQLLLACCRAHESRSPTALPAASDDEWRQLPLRAARLGVVGVVRGALRRLADRGQVPPPAIMRRLEAVYHYQAVRNALLAARLEAILAAFSSHAIPVMMLKGVTLAELVYGDIAMRPMRDLDLLVRPVDVEAGDRVLRTLGYTADESYRSEAWYRRNHHHLAPYRAPDGLALVELHHLVFAPTASVTVPEDHLWARARPAELSVGPALVLAPEDLLLYLCVGLAVVKRFIGGLRTLCDIAAVIRRYQTELDWALLVRAGHRYDIEPYLYYALSLTRELLGADVPDGVCERLRGARVQWFQDLGMRSVIRAAIFRCAADRLTIPAGVIATLLPELLASAARPAPQLEPWSSASGST
jgi:hypothetical protein